MSSHLSDEQLVKLYQQDPTLQDETYNLLVSRYYQDIIKTARGTLYKYSTQRLIYEGIDEKARDIAHDFLLEHFPRVLQKYNTSKGSLNTWISRCVANFTIDSLRRRPKGGIQSFQVEEEEWKSFQIIVEVIGEESLNLIQDRKYLQDILLAHLKRLPEHYQKPIILRFWEEMSIEEIAKALHLPVGTVKSQLSRGIATLRQRLEAEGLDSELR